jgi:hydroxymethylbilane synthase
VECLAREDGLCELLAAIGDPASRAAVTAERSLLAALQGGCSAPVGAYAGHTTQAGAAAHTSAAAHAGAAAQAGTVHLRAGVFDRQGGGAVRTSGSAAAAQARTLGQHLARDLLRRGAGNYISVTQPSDGGDPQ